jgi:LemA protein
LSKYSQNLRIRPFVSPPEFPKLAASPHLGRFWGERLPIPTPEKRVASVRLLKFIQILITFLVAFLAVVVVSFSMLRPVLKDVRMETRAEWAAFARAALERNNLIPGLIESFKGFEPGHSKLVERLLQARSISMRSADPDRIVAAIDEIDRVLEEVRKLGQSKPKLAQYPPFTAQWKKVERISLRISRQRDQYNSAASSYNRLLNVFPQDLLAAAFGFVPLNIYPAIGLTGDYIQ